MAVGLSGRVTHRLPGIGLLLAGGLLALALAQPDPAHLTEEVAGYVNTDRPGIDNHNSPAVAADPTQPAILAEADRIDSPKFSCEVSVSTSAGITWKPLTFALAPDAPNCFWPDVAFDGAGNLLVLYTASGGRFNQPVGVWVQRFDHLTQAGVPVHVAGSEAFHAHFAVQGQRVVVAYVQTPPANADRPLGFEPGPNPLMVVRSEDAGVSFGSPSIISSGERVAHPSVVFGANGSVVVGALDYGDDVDDYEGLHNGQAGPPSSSPWRIVAWRSTDEGVTFGRTIVVAGKVVPPQRVVIDLAPGPSFAADAQHDRVYASWDAGVGAARNVFVAASSDGGATWAPPVIVGPRQGGQLLPAIDVAPGGRVDIVFYDRSRDPHDVLALPTVGSSWNGGRTFTTTTASKQPFDSRVGQGGVQPIPQLGNQLAVYSTRDSLVAFWADTTRAASATEVMDLATATVAPHDRGSRSVALLVLGALLIIAAAGLVARPARARQKG